MGKVAPRIALVHDFLFTFAGAERVLQQLHFLYPDAPIYTAFAYPEIVRRHFPKAQIITSSLQKSWLKRWPWALAGRMPLAIESFNFSQYDIVISSSGAFSHGIITGPSTTHICYCHTPMRYAWDWHSEYLQERGITSGLPRLFAELLLHRLRIWDYLAASRVDQWVPISKTVAERIERFYGKSGTIVSPPVDTDFFDFHKITVKESPAKYAITVSRLSKSKRVDLIMKACDQAGLPLRIGGSGKEREALEKLASSLSIPITFLGQISEEEKRQQIAGASCFIFAAEDDFGIAPIEALGLGVPVISFAKGGGGESIHNGRNGYLFTEPTPESLAATLQEFLEKGVSFDRDHLRSVAELYSKETFSKEIKSLVDRYA